jgi:hypothetical protein
MNSDAISPLGFFILAASWTWCNSVLFITAYNELFEKKIYLYAPWYVTAVNVACLGMSAGAFMVMGARFLQ